MALGFFEIFAIVVAGIIGVVSIVGCCIACICGGNPLCCLGVGVLATLGLSKPRRERQALVIHHAQGYDTTTAQAHLQVHIYRPHNIMLQGHTLLLSIDVHHNSVTIHPSDSSP
jgi:hypothetical protein